MHLQFAEANLMLEGPLQLTGNSWMQSGAYFLRLVPNLTFVCWSVEHDFLIKLVLGHHHGCVFETTDRFKQNLTKITILDRLLPQVS